jgi:hypothetical protein
MTNITSTVPQISLATNPDINNSVNSFVKTDLNKSKANS